MEPAPRAEQPPRILESGLLLLDSGKIIKGRITHGGGEYCVEQSRGEMFVPDHMVQHVCLDLHDAYLKKLGDLNDPSASDHVVLARWCLSYNLLVEARDELRKAVALEPGRIQSRSMLRRLDTLLDGPSNSPRSASTETTGRPFAGLDYEVESLGGLPREDAATFTSRIQPILTNTCGNARCHGETSPDREFTLVNVRLGRHASRVGTQRNLAAVLKQIDFDNPQSSPLVAGLDGTHGGEAIIFRGRSGKKQLDELRAWVASVANDKNSHNLAKRDLQQELQKTVDGKKTPAPRQKLVDRTERKKARIRKQLSDNTDAFDPAKFNRPVQR